MLPESCYKTYFAYEYVDLHTATLDNPKSCRTNETKTDQMYEHDFDPTEYSE